VVSSKIGDVVLMLYCCKGMTVIDGDGKRVFWGLRYILFSAKEGLDAPDNSPSPPFLRLFLFSLLFCGRDVHGERLLLLVLMIRVMYMTIPPAPAFSARQKSCPSLFHFCNFYRGWVGVCGR